MSFYDYVCLTLDCDAYKKVIEISKSIKSDPREYCSKCSMEMTKLFPHTGGFKLKGSGWFKDGYSKTPTTSSDK